MIRWKSIYYSFPVQLVILQFRNHFLFVVIWLLILGSFMGWIGANFGLHYVFLTPEYLGRVSFLSYFIVGIAFGIFLFSWNLSTYLLSAFRFPFLATLRRPFLKFCVNNGLVPVGLLALYVFRILRFNLGHARLSWLLAHVLALVGGTAFFTVMLILYFKWTNKDIFSFLKQRKSPPDLSPPIIGTQRLTKTDFYRLSRRTWRVDRFLTETLRWRPVRGIGHYDIKILMRVFRQNHLNVLVVQLLLMLTLIGLGFMMENRYFRIPTAASLLILYAVIIAVIGAVSFWFKRWTALVWVLLLLLINQVTKYDFFDINCKAYGLDYQQAPVSYDNVALAELLTDSVVQRDRAEAIEILNRWRSKFPAGRNPKMVLVSASGGGLKATLWTMHVLQQLDKATGERFFDHTVLITGASGGMLGAAYYRELMLRKRLGQDIDPQSPVFREKVSRDLLNSIYFAIVTNDIFIPLTTAKNKGIEQRRDRGYMFELQFNENTDSVLDKPLEAYREPERQALIPRIILSPSVVNDGRQLMISPFDISYMMVSNVEQFRRRNISPDAIDFHRLFRDQKADSLSFVSALRMNATYPIVLPSVNLPSDPSLEIADAGFRDNLGSSAAMRFVAAFKDWIRAHTSGVIFVQIAGWQKFDKAYEREKAGWIASLFEPFGILTDLSELQDYEGDTEFGLVAKLLGDDQVDQVRFEYIPTESGARASMSFHLTDFEKADIIRSFDHPDNRRAEQLLLELIGETK